MPNRWPYNTTSWKYLRREKLASVGYVCDLCGDTRRLHVHHVIPLSREQREMRDERAAFPMLEDLQVLCLPCHSKHHGLTIRGLDPELDDSGEWRDFIGEVEHA